MKNKIDPNQAYVNAKDDPFMWGLANSTYNVRRMTQNRKNKKGLVKIEIEILRYFYGGKSSYNKHRTYVDSLQWVKPANWNNKTQKLSKKEENYEVKTNKINQTFAAVQAYVSSKGQQMIDQAYVEDIDFSKVRELFPSRKENRNTLVDWIERYYQRRKDAGDPHGTVKEFLTVKNRVKAFDAHGNRKTQLEDINILWSDGFYIWAKFTAGYSEGTIEKTYVILKTVLHHLYSNRELYGVEFKDYFKNREFKRGKKSKNKPNAMTLEQRDILFNHRFDTPYLEKTRKMMCFQAFTGVRYGDIRNIRPEHIIPDTDTPKALKFEPTKTSRYNVEVEQPLNPQATELLKEVSFDTSYYSTKAQPYNRYILEVIEKLIEAYPEAKFRTKYSSHNMRDTFISIAVQKEVNFKSILKWVGQSSYSVMDRYIELSDEFSEAEMAKTSSKPDFSKPLQKLMKEGGGDDVNLDDLPM